MAVLNDHAQYIQETFPGGINAYIADLRGRAAAGIEVNIRDRVDSELQRLGVSSFAPAEIIGADVVLSPEKGKTSVSEKAEYYKAAAKEKIGDIKDNLADLGGKIGDNAGDKSSNPWFWLILGFIIILIFKILKR